MSYNATISFKTLKAAEIYPFFQEFKKCVSNSLNDIAKDEFLYMPSIRYDYFYKDEKDTVVNEIDRAWAKNVFTMRFLYLSEHELLGVFGVPTSARDIFDNTTYFQNSCDQDYKFEEWAGIPIFERIAEKWKTASDELVKERYTSEEYGEWDEGEEPNLDYYRRTFAYDEVWKMIEDYMWCDEQAVSLSLFGAYELYKLQTFVGLCREEYEAWNRRVNNE